MHLLNKKCKFISKCRHEAKLSLSPTFYIESKNLSSK